MAIIFYPLARTSYGCFPVLVIPGTDKQDRLRRHRTPSLFSTEVRCILFSVVMVREQSAQHRLPLSIRWPHC